LGSFLKASKAANIFYATSFLNGYYALISAKIVLVNILEFFNKLIWSPWSRPKKRHTFWCFHPSLEKPVFIWLYVISSLKCFIGLWMGVCYYLPAVQHWWQCLWTFVGLSNAK
jgi:hypothetical protein